MKLADIKFKMLQQNGQWQAPLPEEEKLVALEAKLRRIEGKLKRKREEQKDNGGGHGNYKKGKFQKKGMKPLPDWMRQRPTKDKLNAPQI